MKSIYEKFHQKTSKQRKIISDNNFTYRNLIKEINYFLKKSSSILDIGSGAGTLSLYYASKGHSVIGIDISRHAVLSARKSAEYLGLRNASFEQKNFPQETPKAKFNLIIFTEVIEHLSEDSKALSKIYDLLDKSGIVVISTPSKNAPLFRLGYADNFDKRVGHLRRYTVEELLNKCKTSGLEPIKIKKVEGIIRNFLFLSSHTGQVLRVVNRFLSGPVTFLDNISLKLLGESNIIVVAKKK